MILLRQKNLMV